MALTVEQVKENVRAVLSHPLTTSHAEISRLTGIHREMIREIRFGIKFDNVLPSLPRLDPKSFRQKCYNCVQWKPGTEEFQGSCTLGIPECVSEGSTWARGSGAYSVTGEEA